MAHILLLTRARGASVEVLPGLEPLPHRVRVAEPSPEAVAAHPTTDVVLLDARTDLISTRAMSRTIDAAHPGLPIIGVFTEGGLIALNPEWRLHDFLLESAGPSEVEARLRRVMTATENALPEPISAGGLTIEEDAYTARLHGVILDLTYKEFELLKHLAQNPGRVLSRAQLLQEVWGYDYFGGTRTVDVHVRRLRAKLGPEHESLIGTVRNVGYRFVDTSAASTDTD